MSPKGEIQAERAERRFGWEAGTRTPIHWSRASCPTIERPPSRSPSFAKASEGFGERDYPGRLEVGQISRGLPRGEFLPKREWKLRVHEGPPLHVASACS